MENETKMPPVHVPEQKEGGQTDTDYSKTEVDKKAAHLLFSVSRERLLHVNDWHQIVGALSADFRLTDEEGDKIHGPASVGKYIRIDIPGPGSNTGDGYDWVQVEAIEDNTSSNAETESILMRVKPCGNPTNSKQDVAHFFGGQASSTFTVHRKGNTVTAGVHGRNEVPNTNTESVLDKARNSTVALAAVAGVSSPQWKGLSKALIEG